MPGRNRKKLNYLYIQKKSPFLFWMLLFFISLFFSGCATVEPEVSFSTPTPPTYPKVERIGVYHKVNKGETLWRIAKTYEVDVRDIVNYNSIPDVAQIEKNQLIFIPGVYSVRDVILDSDEGSKDFIWPVKGKVVKYFNDSVGSRLNKGIDIEVREGEVVKAARTGRVVFVDNLMGYGQTIILDHQDGFYTVYANNVKPLVSLGDLVLKNKEISYVGKGLDDSFLHFEIRKNSKEENPFYYLP